MDIDALASSSSTWINALHLVLTEISLTQNQDHKMSAIWFYFFTNPKSSIFEYNNRKTYIIVFFTIAAPLSIFQTNTKQT